MGTRMKGIYKGFKYTLSQIFVVKAEEEREMEIGHPTDVKHLAHIGWDGGPSGNAAPSWMNEFKTGPDFAATSINGNSFSGPYPWSSQEFSESMRQPSEPEMFKDSAAIPELPNVKKKQKRKLKSKSTSYVSSSLWSSSSRAAKSKSNFMEGGPKTTDIQVQ